MKQLIKTRVGMLWTAALAVVALIAVALSIGTAAPKTVYADDANVHTTAPSLKRANLLKSFTVCWKACTRTAASSQALPSTISSPTACLKRARSRLISRAM